MKKKSANVFAFIGILSVLCFNACKHEPLLGPKDPTINQNRTCSPDTIYFAQTILPILKSSCATSGCHDAATAKNNVDLTNYEKIMANGKIKSYVPEDSDLYKIITKQTYGAMPPTGPLPSEQIDKIYKWIKQGALNNSCMSSINCDTTNVRYDVQIKQLIQQNCVSCHSGSYPPKGILLDSYPELKKSGENGSLLGSVEHMAGFTPMPAGSQTKLKDCEINQIKSWVKSGMPQ